MINTVDFINIDSYLTGNSENAYVLQVSTSSIPGMNIQENDLLVVDRDSSPKIGDIVVAVNHDEKTLRRFESGLEYVRTSDLEKTPSGKMEIWGVVTFLIRRLKSD
jgi:SOS-response transcriptional repressor LexA